MRGLPSAAAALALLLLMTGCVTSEITYIGADGNFISYGTVGGTPEREITYVPTFGHEFRPRPVPAKITHDDEATLIREGYYKVGDIDVNMKKNDPERVTRIFLGEAAKHGGDVVRPEGEARQYRITPTITTPVTPAHLEIVATPYNQQSFTASGISRNPTMLQTVPGNPGSATETIEDRFDSTAAIWRRYDPQEADLEFTERDLSAAAAARQIVLVKSLLQRGASLETSYDTYGNTALQNAVASRDIEMVKLLLDHGANVNSANPKGTPNERKMSDRAYKYSMACNGRWRRTTVPNKPNGGYACFRGTRSPLMIAAWNGDMEMATLLIEHGADVNQAEICHVPPRRMTPLMYAAWQGNVSILKMLVSRGAKVNQTNASGETALFWAARGGPKSWPGFMDNSRPAYNAGHSLAIQWLHQRGVEREDLFGGSVSERKAPAVKALLALGADVNTKAHSMALTELLTQAALGHNSNAKDKRWTVCESLEGYGLSDEDMTEIKAALGCK